MKLFNLIKLTFLTIPFISAASLAATDAPDLAEMVQIPEGEFTMGCDYDADSVRCMKESSPARKVQLKTYLIDKYKVTFSRYQQCIDSGDCTGLYQGGGCNFKLSWNGDHPVNCVTYKQATDFCEWDGKRMPTEAEWEKAARGTDARLHPWGDKPANCDLATMNKKTPGKMGPGCGAGTTQPVTAKPKGASPYGVMGMVGNLFEWTSTEWDKPKNPREIGHKTLKGSSWLMRNPDYMSASTRSSYSPLGQGYVVGFRCVKPID